MSARSAYEGSSMSQPSEPGEIVTFDVGGRIFKVLKEPTLSLFPGSLLNTLAEERENDDPIFVEASPELFPYILEYHRHRKILIPHTVSKEALLREARVMRLDVQPEEICKEEVQIGDAFESIHKLQIELQRRLMRDVVALVGLQRIIGTGCVCKSVTLSKQELIDACLEQTREALQGDVSGVTDLCDRAKISAKNTKGVGKGKNRDPWGGDSDMIYRSDRLYLVPSNVTLTLL